MCSICHQFRPYDPQCPYEAAAAAKAALLAERLAHLERIGIDFADAATLLAGPVTADQVIDPSVGVGFPENDPTGFAPFFDIPSGPGTQVTLGIGQRLNAEISFPNDTDWFRLQLVQGQTYQISMVSLPFFGTGDPMLFLFDNNANLLTSDDNSGGGVNALLTITATRTGLYFVGATGFGGGGNTTGSYQIALSQVNFSADRVGDTNATAGTVQVNGEAFGTIDFIGDVDRYAVQFEKGKSYYVVLDAATLSFTPLSDPKVQIVDAQGRVIAENDDNGITKNSFIAFDIDRSGTYYIRAMGSGVATGDFRLAVVELRPPPEPDLLSGVDWGVKFNKSTIRYYFADINEQVMNETTDSRWSAYEKQQAAAALNEFAKLAPLSFVEVANRANADFVIGKGFLDSSLSGKMAPQDPAFGAIQGQGWFNTNARFWSDEAGGLLERGAYGYSNFVHEFGHGLGLAHPHDDGGGNSEIFPGVRGSGDFGQLGLNQE
ncbi:MAG: pre-peptidase C-terminal domain-containing protein, partial [Gemmobacter sp.]